MRMQRVSVSLICQFHSISTFALDRQTLIPFTCGQLQKYFQAEAAAGPSRRMKCSWFEASHLSTCVPFITLGGNTVPSAWRKPVAPIDAVQCQSGTKSCTKKVLITRICKNHHDCDSEYEHLIARDVHRWWSPKFLPNTTIHILILHSPTWFRVFLVHRSVDSYTYKCRYTTTYIHVTMPLHLILQPLQPLQLPIWMHKFTLVPQEPCGP